MSFFTMLHDTCSRCQGIYVPVLDISKPDPLTMSNTRCVEDNDQDAMSLIAKVIKDSGKAAQQVFRR